MLWVWDVGDSGTGSHAASATNEWIIVECSKYGKYVSHDPEVRS
jgi:hypothetical protein